MNHLERIGNPNLKTDSFVTGMLLGTRSQVEHQIHPLKLTAGTPKLVVGVDVSPLSRGYFQVPAVCFQGCIRRFLPHFQHQKVPDFNRWLSDLQPGEIKRSRLDSPGKRYLFMQKVSTQRVVLFEEFFITVPTKTQLSNFLGTPGEDYFKGNPKSLNFYFLVIWWGKKLCSAPNL